MYSGAAFGLMFRANEIRDHSAHGKRLAGIVLGVIGWLVHGYTLCVAVFRTTGLALSISDAASVVGWVIAAIALAVAAREHRFARLSALMLLVVGVAAAVTDKGPRDVTVNALSWELTTHVIIAIVSYALIAVGAVLAIALLLLDRRLRSHRPLGALAGLPSVEALESGLFQAVGGGFALLSLTLFSGFFFVRDLFGQHLLHKVVLSCIAWLILAVLLFGRWRFGWRGRVASRWALGGFVALGLSYFGAKIVLEIILGKHWG
jgi:ABC-type uncharacterized transport system permease subunit